MPLIRLIILIFIVLVLKPCTNAQNFRSVNNDAFNRGEELQFEVYYQSFITGKVKAGYASLKVTNSEKKYYDRPTYHVVGEGKSVKAFDWFFKVRDRFESYFDESSLLPFFFQRNVHEGGYKKYEEVSFYHLSGKAISRKKTKSVPPGIQDILSAVYYMRTIDFNSAKPGDVFPMPFYLDDSIYNSVIKFNGREKIKTRFGEIQCLSFDPMVATGNVFSNPYPMRIWVTDDKNKIPVLARSEVVVGSVKAELLSFKNLRNPVNFRKND